MDLIVTSGGLGPTADDLTAEVVGEFQGREMVLDAPLEERIAEILRPLVARWPHLDMEAIRRGNRKQAVIPAGSTILEPVGTAPGLVVPPREPGGRPVVVVLPGPPRELQPMWHAAVATPALQAALARRHRVPPAHAAPVRDTRVRDRRDAARGRGAGRRPRAPGDHHLPAPRRGRGRHALRARRRGRLRGLRAASCASATRDTLFSDDGRSVDEQVAALLRDAGRTIATAESCTGGLLAARLTELPGSSGYVRGGLVAYANAAKVELAGVAAELIDVTARCPRRWPQALADGARAATRRRRRRRRHRRRRARRRHAGQAGRARLAQRGRRDGARLTRSVNLPGGRADVRDRSTTVALHLIRRLLLGEPDPPPAPSPAPEGALHSRS